MGYIVMSAKLRRQGAGYERPEFFAPLSYGRDGEPSPEQLLRRDRATVFDNRAAASAAINATIKAATDETVHIDTAMGKGHAHCVALDAGASTSHDDGVGARLHGHAVLRAKGLRVGECGIDGGHQGAGR